MGLFDALEISMRRLCVLLAVVMAGAATVGSHAAERVGGPPKPDAAAPPVGQAAPKTPGTPATAKLKLPEATAAGSEGIAMALLRQKGASFDLDDQGHAQATVMAGPQLDDGVLAQLANLPALESLDIGQSGVSEAGIAHLRGLIGLKRLYLHDLPIADHALINLRNLVDLDVLSLRNTQIEGRGLIYIRGLVHLRVLNLSKTKFSDEALVYLKGLWDLDTLALEDTGMTGAGLVQLKPLDKLRVLNLNGCKVTDADLAGLVGHDALRMLYLKRCKVSEKGVTDLKKKMVSLAVYYF
jgi:Leucine-rich repeat (LRR) protein